MMIKIINGWVTSSQLNFNPAPQQFLDLRKHDLPTLDPLNQTGEEGEEQTAGR